MIRRRPSDFASSLDILGTKLYRLLCSACCLHGGSICSCCYQTLFCGLDHEFLVLFHLASIYNKTSFP